MLWRVFIVLLMASGFATASEVAADDSQPQQQADVQQPDVPKGAFLRPEFHLTDGKTFSAGTAFICRWSETQPPVVLTAWHLFGPSGGLESEIRARDLGKQVRFASLHDPFRQASKHSAKKSGPVIVIPAAGSMQSWFARAGDIAAFEGTTEMESLGLPLAKKNPVEGETIWLFGQVAGGAASDVLLHRATSLGIDDGYLVFLYQNAKLKLRATSGAAILNSKGEIVGVNYGGGEHEGKLYGYANPVERFSSHLYKAIGAAQKK